MSGMSVNALQSLEAYMGFDGPQQHAVAFQGAQNQAQVLAQVQAQLNSAPRSGSMDSQQLQCNPQAVTQTGPVPFLGRQKLNRACNVCHERKIKCNAFQDGVPCDNCKGRYECFLPTSRRGRRPKPATQEGNSQQKSGANAGIIKDNTTSQRGNSQSSTSPNSGTQNPSPQSDLAYAHDQEGSSPAGSAGKRALEEDTYQGTIKPSPDSGLNVRFWGPSHSPNSALEAVMEDAVDNSCTQSDIVHDGEGGVVPRRKKRRTSSMISVGMEEKEILGALGFKSGERVIYSGDTHSLSYLIRQFSGREARHTRMASPPSNEMDKPTTTTRTMTHEAVMQAPDLLITDLPDRASEVQTSLFPYKLSDYPQLDIDDWEYLKAKDCFTFPPREVTDQLVQGYFRHCHIMLPVIHRPAFLRQYLRLRNPDGTPSEPPSPLLLQAILHNASTYASLDVIKAAGFNNRLEAYTAFFLRTRLLYYLAFERSQVTVTQALCLIGGRHEQIGEERGARYWLACGLRLCENQGWHRLTSDTDIPASEKRIWKRIFWTLFVRDASVAIALGNPLGINIQEINTEELTMQDFIEEDLEGVDMRDWGGIEEGDTSVIGKGPTKANRLYMIHVVKCGRIAHQIVDTHFVGMANPTAEKVIACIKALNAWRAALPEEIQYVPDSGTDWTYATFAPLLLEFGFHLCRNLHVRGLNAWKASLPKGKEGQKEMNKIKCSVHTTDMSRLVEELLRFDLIKYTPQSCLTPIFAEMTPIVTEMWATDLSSARYKLAAYKLELFLIATEGFEDMFSSAKWILELFRRVIRRRIELGEKAPFTAPLGKTEEFAKQIQQSQTSRISHNGTRTPVKAIAYTPKPQIAASGLVDVPQQDNATQLMFLDGQTYQDQSLDETTMDFRLDFEHDSLWPENFGLNFDTLNSVETYLGEFLIKSGLSSDSSLPEPIDINSPSCWR